MLLFVTGSGTCGRAAAAPGMMPTVPDSRAEILRATHILVVTIQSADAKPWVPRREPGEERTVSLVVVLDEIVKGKVGQPVGQPIRLEVKQVRVGFAWGPMPGVWSRTAIEPGTKLVAFARAASEDAAGILNDPAAQRLLPANQALVDVHLARDAEAARLDLVALLAKAKPQAASVGFLFAEYLWARHGSAAMAEVREFEPIASFLELPALDRIARTTLLTTMLTAVELSEPPATPQLDRLAIAMFHLLGLAEAKDLHDNLVETYLPNLLDLAGHPRLAAQVFHERPEERKQAAAALRAYRGSASPAALLAWLNR
jgi:hypothetical protein